jgi:hypothetical protein
MNTATAGGTVTSIAEDGIAVLSGIYLQAADEIGRRGYSPFSEYEGELGICIGQALKYAAAAHIEAAITSGAALGTWNWDVDDLAEELETRLAAVLYLTGRAGARTNIRDFPDTVYSWERNSYHNRTDRALKHGQYGYPSQDDAIALLKAAAAIITAAAGA